MAVQRTGNKRNTVTSKDVHSLSKHMLQPLRKNYWQIHQDKIFYFQRVKRPHYEHTTSI